MSQLKARFFTLGTNDILNQIVILFVVGGCICIIGYLIVYLASTHWKPVVLCPSRL